MAHTWWQTGVVYQIYPRSFQDSTGDGIGDLPGITARLDYVQGLGVDAIWISPFFRSPMADFGYDVSDYCDVDPIFGTLGDADALIEAAHERGLKVILDYIPNHCSDQHPWFLEARASRENDRRDWFVWRDAAPDGEPPNNWMSVFGGPAWTLDPVSGQYYRHSFLKEQPDLNWRNPKVLDALDDVLRFWMDRGVDGFRMDAILFGGKDLLERDNPRAEAGSAHKSMGAWDEQQHLHDLGDPFVLEVYARWRKLIDSHVAARDFDSQVDAVIPPERVAIGEIHEYDPEKWARYFDGPAGGGAAGSGGLASGDGAGGPSAGGTAGAGLHLPFNFGLLKQPWTAEAVRNHVEAIENASRDRGWPTYVLGNHDEPRLAKRLGEESTRLAAMLLLTLRGTPTLYYGDEIGMQEGDIPETLRQDPWGLNVDPALGRDGCRTPMQWDAGRAAGFSSGTPWLPVSDDHAFRNVLVQEDEPDSLLNLYQRLLALRRKHPALHRGSFEAVDGGAEDCFCFLREAPDTPGHFKRLFVALNFGAEPAHVVVPAPSRVLLWSHAPGEDTNLVEMVRLGPKEGAVLVLFA